MEQRITKKIIDIIKTLVYEPGGDPIHETLGPASDLMSLLTPNNISEIDDEIIDILRGNNIEKYNYLEDFGFPRYEETKSE